ncbi:Decaprenyl diphosphate synthase-like protein [Exophiala viscosa]|uniref:Decaprenyl diphosphate synthase-like protein n=1 Tax=Exophiala viscosa TaxID=2486360 RepID=UPI002191B4F2|nr:Decaprenyl diphosphate synthase-like protein [Exophiala viscosa]
MPPFNSADTTTYRKDVASGGRALTVVERERLLQQYLPAAPVQHPSNMNTRSSTTTTSQKPRGHKRRLRPYLKARLHFLIFFLIQFVFGVYIRLRQFYHSVLDRLLAIRHYHHRTPEYIQRDVKSLDRIPEHLSVILKFKSEEDGGLEALLDEVAELSAWAASAGIPLLSVYEKSGILKTYITSLQDLVNQKLASYFGPAPKAPSLRVFAPNHPSTTASPQILAQTPNKALSTTSERPHLDLLLLSATDGRDTLVDLTRTLAEMAQAQKISPKDITSNLINTEISATTAIADSKTVNGRGTPKSQKEVGAGEPDLVIVFGPYVKLDGYPPWQIRLSEIYCVGDPSRDSSGGASTRVEYQAFLRGLWKYAGAEMRFGR